MELTKIIIFFYQKEIINLLKDEELKRTPHPRKKSKTKLKNEIKQ